MMLFMLLKHVVMDARRQWCLNCLESSQEKRAKERAEADKEKKLRKKARQKAKKEAERKKKEDEEAAKAAEDAAKREAAERKAREAADRRRAEDAEQQKRGTVKKPPTAQRRSPGAEDADASPEGPSNVPSSSHRRLGSGTSGLLSSSEEDGASTSSEGELHAMRAQLAVLEERLVSAEATAAARATALLQRDATIESQRAALQERSDALAAVQAERAALVSRVQQLERELAAARALVGGSSANGDAEGASRPHSRSEAESRGGRGSDDGEEGRRGYAQGYRATAHAGARKDGGRPAVVQVRGCVEYMFWSGCRHRRDHRHAKPRGLLGVTGRLQQQGLRRTWLQTTCCRTAMRRLWGRRWGGGTRWRPRQTASIRLGLGSTARRLGMRLTWQRRPTRCVWGGSWMPHVVV